MYKIGDFVVHSGHGLCSITEVASNAEKPFYRLETYHNKMSIMMPFEKAVLYLRPILSKQEILKEIEGSVLLSSDYVKDNKERRMIFQQLIISNDIKDTLHLLKMLYRISEDKKLEKKTLGSFDTQFLQQAERKLFNEVEIATGMNKSEVQALIYNHLKANYVYE